MKFQFDGTIEEFKTVFRGDFDPTDYETKMNFLGSGEDIAPVEDNFGDPPLGLVEPIVMPVNKANEGDLQELTQKQRDGVKGVIEDFCLQWTQGFEVEGADQPDREKLLEMVGSGQWAVPFLVLCYEQESLQSLVGSALEGEKRKEFESEEDWWDWVDRVCCTMVQVSQRGFPDLQGTYDYSTRWKRKALEETTNAAN